MVVEDVDELVAGGGLRVVVGFGVDSLRVPVLSEERQQQAN